MQYLPPNSKVSLEFIDSLKNDDSDMDFDGCWTHRQNQQLYISPEAELQAFSALPYQKVS